HPNQVDHLKKALYDLKQAPRVWYDTLSRFLLANGFSKGVVDPTLFIWKIGTINMGLWYPKDIAMALTAYADADHASCQDTRRSTSRSAQFLGDKEQVENGVVELYFVRTEYQLADIFTKALHRERFKFILPRLGMKCMKPETLKRLQDDKGE
ncbi:retrovirus-related pol polyprotein from transposon TNT 1-94, partial [Tanacetum coccineum]